MFEPLKMRFRALVDRFFAPSRPKRPEPPRQDPESSDKRSFDRYFVPFPVLVSGNDADRQPFQEKTQLQDISGSGARFLTRFPERYHVGQLLRVSILLDGAHDVRACISNEAGVVRIDPPETPDTETGRPFQGIAIRFHYSFDFQRIDSEDNGCLE